MHLAELGQLWKSAILHSHDR